MAKSAVYFQIGPDSENKAEVILEKAKTLVAQMSPDVEVYDTGVRRSRDGVETLIWVGYRGKVSDVRAVDKSKIHQDVGC